MHLTWTSYTEEYATELGLTLNDIQAILTSTTAFHERVSVPSTPTSTRASESPSTPTHARCYASNTI